MEGRQLGLIFLRLIPACATKTRGFNFLHSKYSRSCSTIQHHCGSPGMTKARDPRPARKKTVSWLASLAICTCRAFSPHFLTGFCFEPRGGYQPDEIEPNRDQSGKQALACNQNTAGVLPKKLVAPTSVGATSLNAVAQGFEPWVAVTPHSISSAAPSAARTRYLGTPQ